MNSSQQTTLEILLIFGVVLLFSRAQLPAILNSLFTYNPTPKLELNPVSEIKLPSINVNP